MDIEILAILNFKGNIFVGVVETKVHEITIWNRL